MTAQPLKTYFATAVRAPQREVHRQADSLAVSLPEHTLFDAIPDLLLILNEQRQIVFANQALLKVAEISTVDQAQGFRPGEILNCIHSSEMEAGCGTSTFCRVCGAVRAILTSLNGKDDVQDCRITQKNGDALDLRVWSTPLVLGDERYSLLVLKDISHEKRRQMLEHVFFHDILNSAGVLQGLADILPRVPPQEVESVADEISQVCGRLIEEIKSQKELVAAENGKLDVEFSLIPTLQFLQEMVDMYRRHEVASGRYIKLDLQACDIILVSDRALLQRVLGNMVKNALEACQMGQTVSVGCQEKDGKVTIWVHNPGVIPKDDQLQIFQRSFSTKGPGRGLGTYSIKLLGEVYLNGEVSFSSSEKKGTLFRIILPVE